MGTLSSFCFSLISPNGCNFGDKFQNNRTKCFLCGELLLKRRQRLLVTGDFRRLNSVIRSCYNDEKNNSSNDDSDSNNGERERKENSSLATMTPAEKKSEDNADNPPASVSSRVS